VTANISNDATLSNRAVETSASNDLGFFNNFGELYSDTSEDIDETNGVVNSTTFPEIIINVRYLSSNEMLYNESAALPEDDKTINELSSSKRKRRDSKFGDDVGGHLRKFADSGIAVTSVDTTRHKRRHGRDNCYQFLKIRSAAEEEVAPENGPAVDFNKLYRHVKSHHKPRPTVKDPT